MRYPLITATVTFFLGLSVGVFAFDPGDKPVTGKESGYPPDRGETVASVSSVTREKVLKGKKTPQVAGGSVNDQVGMKTKPVTDSKMPGVLNTRWAKQERLIIEMQERLLSLEQQMSALVTERRLEAEEQAEATVEIMPVSTPEDRRNALIASGVGRTSAGEIVARQSRLELERLELQDVAFREGWYQSSRYFEALRELNADRVDLRTEISERAYDEYLYRTGKTNRVKIISVIPGSAAELSGLEVGDVIETYGDDVIYEYSDLRSATGEGVRGETVPVLIRRGDHYLESDISRGPMGVRLESLSIPPGG
ncbi:MAG: PDZ domain-containing protein [Gammaproteobacteria bacterium]|nr:PDZ domain-containing protein [Gammaproteobacteria bacterium]